MQTAPETQGSGWALPRPHRRAEFSVSNFKERGDVLLQTKSRLASATVETVDKVLHAVFLLGTVTPCMGKRLSWPFLGTDSHHYEALLLFFAVRSERLCL